MIERLSLCPHPECGAVVEPGRIYCNHHSGMFIKTPPIQQPLGALREETCANPACRKRFHSGVSITGQSASKYCSLQCQLQVEGVNAKPTQDIASIIGAGVRMDELMAAANKKKSMSFRYPKYYKDVSHLTEIDVYGVHALFNIQDPSGCIQHASKKLLLSGVRTGGKSKFKDIEEARDTLNRWLELNPETKEITNV